ncbi:MAG: GyrI-like domain-containing protein [Bacteroidia bacterium]
MQTAVKHQVSEISWPKKTFFIKRAVKSIEQLPQFFTESYGAIFGPLGTNDITPTGVPCAIYYSIDEAKNQTDLAAAVPVNNNVPDIQGLEKLAIPASKVITTTHFGPYENMAPAYQEMEKYLAEHDLKKELIIEEYFSDPAKEPDPAKWKTNIYFVVK